MFVIKRYKIHQTELDDFKKINFHPALLQQAVEGSGGISGKSEGKRKHTLSKRRTNSHSSQSQIPTNLGMLTTIHDGFKFPKRMNRRQSPKAKEFRNGQNENNKKTVNHSPKVGTRIDNEDMGLSLKGEADRHRGNYSRKHSKTCIYLKS